MASVRLHPSILLAGAALLASSSAMIGCSQDSAAAGRSGIESGGSLRAFASDSELREFLSKRREMQQRKRAQLPGIVASPMAADSAAQEAAVPASRASDSITNNQEASVDEGGIVKKRGDLLVILRRGRLFTVSIAEGKLRPVDRIDAFPPGVNARNDWYDEMLLSGDRVIVIGYSYGRGGTEINRFRLSNDGHLRFEDAYHLRSNDYYSSRNYASRLIGTRLVYYTPLYLAWSGDPLESFPALRRWTGDSKDAFHRVLGARETYVVPRLRDNPDVELNTLHTVMDCDLTRAVLDCEGKAVLGPPSRNFYVSPDAVYLWVSDAWGWRSDRRRGAQAFVYRLPFNRGRPAAIAARGNPTDQFSFREDRRNRLLDVLVRSDGGGDWMWSPEVSEGDVALLSIPIFEFGDGSEEVGRDRYRPLPSPGRQSWNFQNRFVGNFVLYGGGAFGEGRAATLYAVQLRGGPVSRLPLRHAVQRIDALGRDAVVVGSDRESLAFTAIDLTGQRARSGDLFVLPEASEGETRSHGFFYRSDSVDGSSGLLGLPISRRVEPAYRRFFGSAASMLFLRRDARRFGHAGELDSDVSGVADDDCSASCVDWYGNARPIFADGRIFALLGYELVEGRMIGGRIREVDRVNFAPSFSSWRR